MTETERDKERQRETERNRERQRETERDSKRVTWTAFAILAMFSLWMQIFTHFFFT